MIKTWPERIWLQSGCDETPDYVEMMGNEATWCQDNINESDVEYIRADLAALAAVVLVVEPLDCDSLQSREILEQRIAALQHIIDRERQASGEPVAQVITIAQGGNSGKQVVLLKDVPNGTKLYTTPPAAKQMQEACAKICDEYPLRDPAEDGNGYWAAEECTKAIRALDPAISAKEWSDEAIAQKWTDITGVPADFTWLSNHIPSEKIVEFAKEMAKGKL